LFYELGIRYPAIRFVPTETIDPGCFRFKINHLTTLPWRGLQSNECLVNETPDRLRRFLQLEVSPASVSPANVSIATVQAAQEVPDSSPLMDIQARPCSNPANRNPCSVIDIKHEPAAKAAGFTTWNAMGYLVLVSSYELRTHATCFCDRDVVATELKNLENTLPKLVSFAQAKIPLEWLTQMLRCLLAEEISIRNLRQILQAIVDYDYIVTDDSQFIIFDPRLVAHQEPGEDWLYDPVNLAAFIRTTMKRYISYKYTRGQNTLVVYLLDSEIEQLLTNDEATAAAQHHTKLATEDRRRILAAVREELKGVSSSATTPAVLTVTDVRHAFQSLIYPEFPYVPVLSYQELSLDMNIQPIARISIV
jgi:type III secretion protein V